MFEIKIIGFQKSYIIDDDINLILKWSWKVLLKSTQKS